MPTIDIDPFTWIHGTKDIKGVVMNIYQDHRDHGQLSQITLDAEQATKLRDSITLLLESTSCQSE